MAYVLMYEHKKKLIAKNQDYKCINNNCNIVQNYDCPLWKKGEGIFDEAGFELDVKTRLPVIFDYDNVNINNINIDDIYNDDMSACSISDLRALCVSCNTVKNIRLAKILKILKNKEIIFVDLSSRNEIIKIPYEVKNILQNNINVEEIKTYFKEYFNKIKIYLIENFYLKEQSFVMQQLYTLRLFISQHFNKKVKNLIINNYPHYSNFNQNLQYKNLADILKSDTYKNNQSLDVYIDKITDFFSQECMYESYLFIKTLFADKIYLNNTNYINYFCNTLNIIDKKIFNLPLSNEMYIHNHTFNYLLIHSLNKILYNIYNVWDLNYNAFKNSNVYEEFLIDYYKIITDKLTEQNAIDSVYCLPEIFLNSNIPNKECLKNNFDLWITELYSNGTNNDYDIFMAYEALNNYLINYYEKITKQ